MHSRIHVLTIPRIYIDILGNIKSALFLSRCIYWTGVLGEPFHKTYKEWEDDTGLSRVEIDTARRECEGLIITSLKKVDGTPILHYSIEWENLQEAIYKQEAEYERA